MQENNHRKRINTDNQQDQINTDNQNALLKFVNYMNQFRNNHLKEGVKNIYGRHYAIKFNPQYSFRQQWQSKIKTSQETNFYQIIQSQLFIGYLYTIIFLLFEVFLIWYYSIFRVIGLIEDQKTIIVFLLSILFTIIDSSIKYHLKFTKCAVNMDKYEITKTFKQPIILIIYYSLNLSFLYFSIYFQSQPIAYLIDIIAIVLLYKRARQLFKHFKIRSYTTPYKHYFKILDLTSNILAIQHIFAIIIYLASFYDAQNNWLQHYGKLGVSNFEKYYYSIYFTSTTIFTIGYGDILPMNYLQILCVLIMQMFGTANFSYLINEIGYTLSTMRKQQQQLQHNISTLSKMGQYYKIQSDLQNLAKQYLVNSKKRIEDIKPQDQNKVLMKLSDDLRQSLIHDNNLNIIKSSLFFICHWTKTFQIQIAKKLVKKILNPNEVLIQFTGKEKIYIIKSGKLEVYTNTCYGYKKNFKKLLKTIQPSTKIQISDNIYGYTSVISNKPVKINAISKDFTCVYYIDKNNFLESVHENKLDIQYYFQIKTKLDCSKHVQSYEAPAVLNIRQHYRPIETFVIKRHVHKLNKLKNTRKYIMRRSRSLHSTQVKVCRQEQDYQRCATSNEIRLTYCQYEQGTTPARVSIKQQTTTNLAKQSTQTTYYEYSKQILMRIQFEIMKQYNKYFKSFNASNLIQKMERQNYFLDKQGDNGKYQSQQITYVFNKLRKNGKTNKQIPLN